MEYAPQGDTQKHVKSRPRRADGLQSNEGIRYASGYGANDVSTCRHNRNRMTADLW